MRLADLDYELPPELIAQHPPQRREDARLLVVDRGRDALHDTTVTDLMAWLRPGDVLALNETRVRPARLEVRRPTGGRIVLLVVRPAEPPGHWRVLARPARNARAGTRLETPDGSLALEVTAEEPDGARVVRVIAGDLDDALRRLGEVPLPPYIHRAPEPGDRERYQTVFARVDGAVAAPTAALHFSESLLAQLEGAGVGAVRVLLHVGPGTFRPIVEEDPRRHRMDEEWYEVAAESAEALAAARRRGGRIVAVGTTVVRALESACDANAGVLAGARGWTRAFIHPPHAFRAVDALVTNFHLPRTSLLLLVAAFAGQDLVRRAYAHAVAERYRFYSYGDAMLIV